MAEASIGFFMSEATNTVAALLIISTGYGHHHTHTHTHISLSFSLSLSLSLSPRTWTSILSSQASFSARTTTPRLLRDLSNGLDAPGTRLDARTTLFPIFLETAPAIF